jgi:hypothetical protein
MFGGRQQPTLFRDGFQIFAAIEIGLFVLLWVGFGVGAFFHIRSWEAEHDRRMAAIRAGEVEPVTLYVLAAYRDEGRGTWLVKLGTGESGVVACRQAASIEGLAVGTPMEAYRYPDGYFIPRFYNDVRWGKYAFLAFGLLPLPVLGLVLAVRRARRPRPTAATGVSP